MCCFITKDVKERGGEIGKNFFRARSPQGGSVLSAQSSPGPGFLYTAQYIDI